MPEAMKMSSQQYVVVEHTQKYHVLLLRRILHLDKRLTAFLVAHNPNRRRVVDVQAHAQIFVRVHQRNQLRVFIDGKRQTQLVAEVNTSANPCSVCGLISIWCSKTVARNWSPSSFDCVSK